MTIGGLEFRRAPLKRGVDKDSLMTVRDLQVRHVAFENVEDPAASEGTSVHPFNRR
jgi:hypothetical protein